MQRSGAMYAPSRGQNRPHVTGLVIDCYCCVTQVFIKCYSSFVFDYGTLPYYLKSYSGVVW